MLGDNKYPKTEADAFVILANRPIDSTYRQKQKQAQQQRKESKKKDDEAANATSFAQKQARKDVTCWCCGKKGHYPTRKECPDFIDDRSQWWINKKMVAQQRKIDELTGAADDDSDDDASTASGISTSRSVSGYQVRRVQGLQLSQMANYKPSHASKGLQFCQMVKSKLTKLSDTPKPNLSLSAIKAKADTIKSKADTLRSSLKNASDKLRSKLKPSSDAASDNSIVDAKLEELLEGVAIDSGSAIGSTIRNKRFLCNIGPAKRFCEMITNGGNKNLNTEGDLKQPFHQLGKGYWHPTNMANIIGLGPATKHCRITFDSAKENTFFMHTDVGIVPFPINDAVCLVP